MSPDPNKSSQSSKSASSPKPRTEAQANLAPETSSPAETMTDQSSKATLITPPTRMTTPDEAVSKPDESNAVGSNQPSDHSTSTPVTQTEPTISEDSVTSTDSTEAMPVKQANASAVPLDPPAAETSFAETSSAEAVEPAKASSEQAAEPTITSQSVATEAETANDVRASNQANQPSGSSKLSDSNSQTDSQANGQTSNQPAPGLRQQPIPPASEPMQYRAIGLVRGKYTPSEEQFTRGFILTDDGVTIDAVLLGRVMSLVKKHINLDESHLWVVYPRTREKNLELHMQIVGVWEPEKLNRAGGSMDAHADDTDDSDDSDDVDDSDLDSDTELEAELDNSEQAEEIAAQNSAAEANQPDLATAPAPTLGIALTPPEELDDRYFSVRGEVVYQSEEEQRLLVKIRRAPKQGTTQARAFKVALKGTLAGKALGYFWDLHVQREDNELVVKEATQIGMVPPQKKRDNGGKRRGPSGPRRGGNQGRGSNQAGGPPRKRWDNNREGQPSNRPMRGERPDRPDRSDRSAASSNPRPVPKPIKRRPKPEES